MPIDYRKYPDNWLSEIRPAILQRANNKCECCGVSNYALGHRENGVFIYAGASPKPKGIKEIKIVLTIAHLNQDITDNDYSNLKALCQKCHFDHDREDNIKRKQFGKDYNSDHQLNLFYDFGEWEKNPRL